MSIHYSAETFANAQVIKRATPFQVQVKRSFDLPPVLHALTVGLYFAFLGVMAIAFQDRGLIIPMAIFVVYIVMAFGVPAMWVRMKPGHDGAALAWADFGQSGIDTFTGNMSAKDATGQVLILPLLILGWGLAIAVIAAVVR
ncbi:MAG: hypothetical protein IBJ12_09405 [Sphingomonadaceae bacterium]|nr:hypothetical protein [Sphingomonadaceae bacterium]